MIFISFHACHPLTRLTDAPEEHPEAKEKAADLFSPPRQAKPPLIPRDPFIICADVVNATPNIRGGAGFYALSR